jgi:hypothetical protein
MACLRVNVGLVVALLGSVSTACAPTLNRESCGGLQCADGQVCVAGDCRWSCTTTPDCPDNLVCEAGVCFASPSSSSSGGAGTSSASHASSAVTGGATSQAATSTLFPSSGPASSSSSVVGVSSTSQPASSSSSGVDCAAQAGGCFVGTRVNGSCQFTYKCPYGQICVAPGDVCGAYPAPPVQGNDPAGGECYIVHANARTFLVCNLVGSWADGQTYCRGFGGFDLGRVSSAEEQAALGALLSGGRGWLGLNDQAVEGVYAWSDGAPLTYGSTLGQAPWCNGFPLSSNTSNCVEFVAGASSDCWENSACTNADRGIICSR